MSKPLLAVLAALLSWQVMAASTGDLSTLLKPDHPESYTVQQGDTLWDISGRFLSQPWVWPELWRANPQIENPHLIYPGDVIRLVYVDGQPVLMLERGTGGRAGAAGGGDGRLSPRVRESRLDSAIPAIRLDAIESFLAQNRVVAPGELEAAAYVLAGESRRIVLGAGDRAYGRGSVQPAASYGIFRRGPLYVDPDTDEVLGQQATDIGAAQVVGIDDSGVSTLSITSSREEVRRGDRLLPTEERRLDATFFPSSPQAPVDGRIIAVAGGVANIGQWDVVVVNRGTSNGLEVGNVLAVMGRGELARDVVSGERVRLPSERAGLLMVFRAFDRLSYGLVLETIRPLAVLDEVRNP
jgi:nucleoid-associated protein YgaU